MSYRAGEPELRVCLTMAELIAITEATEHYTELDGARDIFSCGMINGEREPDREYWAGALHRAATKLHERLDRTHAPPVQRAPTPDAIATILQRAALVGR